jgi:hypothetical protein
LLVEDMLKAVENNYTGNQGHNPGADRLTARQYPRVNEFDSNYTYLEKCTNLNPVS